MISSFQATAKEQSSSIRDGRPPQKFRGSAPGTDANQVDVTGFLGLLQGMMTGGAMSSLAQVQVRPTSPSKVAGTGRQDLHAAEPNVKVQLGQVLATDVRSQANATPAGPGKHDVPAQTPTHVQQESKAIDNTLGQLPFGLGQQISKFVHDAASYTTPATATDAVTNAPKANKPLARLAGTETKPMLHMANTTGPELANPTALGTAVSVVNRTDLPSNPAGNTTWPTLASSTASSFQSLAKSQKGSAEDLTSKSGLPKHVTDSGTPSAGNSLPSAQAVFASLPGHLAQAKVAPVPVTVSTSDPKVHEQIGQIVVQQAKVGPNQIQVRVMPEGMGSLVISVSQTPGGVAVHVEANAMQTLQWLQQTANQVMDAVRSSGVEVSGLGLSFGQANLGNNQAGQQAPRKGRTFDKVALSGAPAAAAMPQKSRNADHAVDVSAHRISVRV